MSNYSEAVILEGDNPLEHADREVFVAAVPDTGEALCVRRQRDVAAAQRARVDAWERMLSQRDGIATWMEEVVGISVGELLRKKPVTERFAGIERAGLVVVNIRHQRERASADKLVVDVHRRRQDDALERPVARICGSGRVGSMATAWYRPARVTAIARGRSQPPLV